MVVSFHDTASHIAASLSPSDTRMHTHARARARARNVYRVHTRDETLRRRLDDARSTFIGIFMAAGCAGTNFYRFVVFAAVAVDAGFGFRFLRRKSRYLFISSS